MRRALIRWLARAYATVDRRARLVVLTLHRVGGTSRIIPEHLERDFAFLAERYEARACRDRAGARDRRAAPARREPLPEAEPRRRPRPRVAVFRSVAVHPEPHTLVWPNGANLALEFLHERARMSA